MMVLIFVQSLYLTDRSSTHGTFIGEERLPAKLDVAIKSGTVVTFGQKVISNTGELILVGMTRTVLTIRSRASCEACIYHL